MKKFIQSLYEQHHRDGRREGFSMFEKERGRVFAQWIGQNKSILDLGCRDGTLTKYYAKNNRVIGLDIDQRLLKKAEEKLQISTINLDIYEEWKFKQKFDVIVIGEVLEHLYYPEKIISKISNNLNNEGLCLISVPNAYMLSSRIRFLFGQEIPAHFDPTHINLFSVKKIIKILEKYFVIEQVKGISTPIYKWLLPLSINYFAANILIKAKLKTI